MHWFVYFTKILEKDVCISSIWFCCYLLHVAKDRGEWTVSHLTVNCDVFDIYVNMVDTEQSILPRYVKHFLQRSRILISNTLPARAWLIFITCVLSSPAPVRSNVFCVRCACTVQRPWTNSCENISSDWCPLPCRGEYKENFRQCCR